MADRSRLRCAIYTRKSTEEGLEQSFNSLDAQREACAAYVLSQRHEGWQLSPELYDDGGYTGGNMERPGLRQLMADVAAGRVDVIVVYKVDRLTRSLADFAKIVEVLDKAGASFVSVTQAFNTTTSMGRLTLNVLLSFAQFEREVTGERIRDKVAASKAKGMWMGGPVPLGYDLADRRLTTNEAEAVIVRRIFERYRQLRSVGLLAEELERDGVRTKRRVWRDNRVVGDIPFTKGPLAYLLANRVYAGEVEHNGNIYAGEHPAIISRELWDEVQAIAAANRVERRLGSKAKAPSLLTGMLSDSNGRPMSPSYAVRNARRYRYYVTRAAAAGQRDVTDRLRIPAAAIEGLVAAQLASWFEQGMPGTAADAADTEGTRTKAQCATETLQHGPQHEQRAILVDLDVRVAIGPETVLIDFLAPGSHASGRTQLEVLAKLVDRGSDLKLAIGPNGTSTHAEPDPVLLKLIVLGFAARDRMTSGNPDPLVDHYSRQHQARLARLGYLAPDIISAIVEGRQPPSMNGRRLLRAADLPTEWSSQRRLLGFS